MIDEEPIEHRIDSRWIWCGVIALVALAVTLIRVPTKLGVQVPETRIPGFDLTQANLTSHEHVWRVWWRARDDFISIHPQGVVTVALAVMLVVFATCVICLVWFALAPGPESVETVE
jgi:hypothetical protein